MFLRCCIPWKTTTDLIKTFTLTLINHCKISLMLRNYQYDQFSTTSLYYNQVQKILLINSLLNQNTLSNSVFQGSSLFHNNTTPPSNNFNLNSRPLIQISNKEDDVCKFINSNENKIFQSEVQTTSTMPQDLPTPNCKSPSGLNNESLSDNNPVKIDNNNKNGKISKNNNNNYLIF